jgi:hypothetical protein
MLPQSYTDGVSARLLRQFTPTFTAYNVQKRLENVLELVKKGDYSETLFTPEELKKIGNRHVVIPFIWSIPTPKAIGSIANVIKEDMMVSVFSGNGWWEAALSQALRSDDRLPLEVFASDIKQPDPRYTPPDFTVAEISAIDSVVNFTKTFGACKFALFMSWPPLDLRSHEDADAVKHYRTNGGQTLCIIGEKNGGCTGSEELASELEEFWDVEDYDSTLFELQQWDTISDFVMFFKPKGEDSDDDSSSESTNSCEE